MYPKPILEPFGYYKFSRLFYRGFWSASYDENNNPIKQICSYIYLPPGEIYKLHPPNYYVQVKYFYEGHCIDDDDWHTVIYVCNVYRDGTIHWTSGQELIYQPVKYNVELKLFPFMRNNIPIRWLEATNGWNVHCGLRLGWDSSYTQYFVADERSFEGEKTAVFYACPLPQPQRILGPALVAMGLFLPIAAVFVMHQFKRVRLI